VGSADGFGSATAVLLRLLLAAPHVGDVVGGDEMAIRMGSRSAERSVLAPIVREMTGMGGSRLGDQR